MIRNVIMFLLAAFVAAGCSGADFRRPDWCYTFDFTSGLQGVSITQGAHNIGTGLSPDNGKLIATYTHTSIVNPNAFIATIEAPSAQGLFVVRYDIFGLTGAYADAIPLAGVFDLAEQNPNDLNNVIGSRMEIELETSADLRLRSIQVQGFNPNPFPSNECPSDDPATSTPPGLPPTADPRPVLENNPQVTFNECRYGEYQYSANDVNSESPPVFFDNLQLPPGLTMSRTGLLSGVPEAGTAGSYTPNQLIRGVGNVDNIYALNIVILPGAAGECATPTPTATATPAPPEIYLLRVPEWRIGGTWSHTSGQGVGDIFDMRAFIPQGSQLLGHIIEYDIGDEDWSARPGMLYNGAGRSNVVPGVFAIGPRDGWGCVEFYYSPPFNQGFCDEGLTLLQSQYSPSASFNRIHDIAFGSMPQPLTSNSPQAITFQNYITTTNGSEPGYVSFSEHYLILNGNPPPEPTPTPTATATITPTPSANSACNFVNYTFDQGLTGWSVTQPVSSNQGAAALGDEGAVEQTVNVDAGVYIMRVRYRVPNGSSGAQVDFNFISTIAGSFSASTVNYTVTSDSTALTTFTAQQVYNITSTGPAEMKIEAILTGLSEVAVLDLCFYNEANPPESVDDNPLTGPSAGIAGGGAGALTATPPPVDSVTGADWATCNEIITPPEGLTPEEWTAYAAVRQDQTLNCEVADVLDNINEQLVDINGQITDASEALDAAAEVAGRSLTGYADNAAAQAQWELENAIRSSAITGAIGISPNGEQAVIGAGIGGLLGYQGDSVEDLNEQANDFIGLWRDTAPQTPPGLPDCINAPLESDICALWYVMEFTVFAGIGALIIPLLSTVVNIGTALYVANQVRNIVLRLWQMIED